MSRVAIIGTGPAALMAAWVVSKAGHAVTLFEKKRGAGQKLLIAGASGLNITHDAPLQTFHEHYRGDADFLRASFAQFSPESWIAFIENLGIATFKGTSRRYFVDGLKSTSLLKAWIKKLKEQGATFKYSHEVVGFASQTEGVRLDFKNGTSDVFDAVCFALGGGSYEPREKPLRWIKMFDGFQFRAFESSNAGFEVAWPEAFVAEAEGQPLKNVALTSSRGTLRGDLVVTRYGLEGTPLYSLGESGTVFLDLKPDMTARAILLKIEASKENLSPIRRVKKYLNLSPAALALLFHLTDHASRDKLNTLVERMKRFPIELSAPRPLDEAISSAGGLALDELNAHAMLKKSPGVFCAGEMLDWDAPTGGFLIQACASQGFVAGEGIVAYLTSVSEAKHAPALQKSRPAKKRSNPR